MMASVAKSPPQLSPSPLRGGVGDEPAIACIGQGSSATAGTLSAEKPAPQEPTPRP